MISGEEAAQAVLKAAEADTPQWVWYVMGLMATACGAMWVWVKVMVSQAREDQRETRVLLDQSAVDHRKTIERLEKEKDAIQREKERLYDRMLDAAHSAQRGERSLTRSGSPPDGIKRLMMTEDEKIRRLKTVTENLTPEQSALAQRLFAEALSQGRL